MLSARAMCNARPSDQEASQPSSAFSSRKQVDPGVMTEDGAPIFDAYTILCSVWKPICDGL